MFVLLFVYYNLNYFALEVQTLLCIPLKFAYLIYTNMHVTDCMKSTTLLKTCSILKQRFKFHFAFIISKIIMF